MEDIEQAPFRTAMYVYELRKLLRYIRNADCITKSSVFYVRFLSTLRTISSMLGAAGPGNEASSCVNFVDVIAMNNLTKWRIAASISVGLPENYRLVRVLSLRTMSSRYNSG